MGEIDKVTWYAMGTLLTTLGLVLSYLRYQRKGVAAGVRAAAWSLLPVALALTGTLKLGGQILDDVASWAVHLVFSPLVWVGICLAGVSVALFVLSGWMGRRSSGPGRGRGAEQVTAYGSRSTARVHDDSGDPGDLDDMADIESILRRHGIS